MKMTINESNDINILYDGYWHLIGKEGSKTKIAPPNYQHFKKKDYIKIGDSLKKLPIIKRTTEYRKWNSIFKVDNPRYDSKRFKKHIGL